MGIRDWLKSKKTPKTDVLALECVWLPDVRQPAYASLFITVSDEDVRGALENWNWLPLAGLTVCAVSSFGEVFFQNADGVVFQIDTIEGKLSKVSDSVSDFKKLLMLEEERDKLLFAGFVYSMKRNGFFLESGECYDFKIPPILGGEFNIDNIEKTSFVVKLGIAGQIHRQVKDLPDGTEISEIKISH